MLRRLLHLLSQCPDAVMLAVAVTLRLADPTRSRVLLPTCVWRRPLPGHHGELGSRADLLQRDHGTIDRPHAGGEPLPRAAPADGFPRHHPGWELQADTIPCFLSWTLFSMRMLCVKPEM